MSEPEPEIPEPAKRQHWVYVFDDPSLRASAWRWRNRKIAQGKLYEVIEAHPETPDRRLAVVGNDDVLYVYAGTLPGSPEQLMAHVAGEGLDAGHGELKLFFARSGDAPAGGTASYAERLYRCMRPGFSRIVVYGYSGEVSPEGFRLHKTAAMASGEGLEDFTEAEWDARRLRAKENRVRFPPEGSGSTPST